jgi:hypothetical protein
LRRQGAARAGAGERHRSGGRAHRARECAAQRLRALVECLHAPGLARPVSRARRRSTWCFANILLAPLTRLARPMRRVLAPGARVVLSGLLAAQENAALAAYRPHGLKLVRRIPLGEWVTLVLRDADTAHCACQRGGMRRPAGEDHATADASVSRRGPCGDRRARDAVHRDLAHRLTHPRLDQRVIAAPE